MTTVILHIGAFKTGTSYLQTVLAGGRDRLAALGVLWPGVNWLAQVAAARGLIKLRPAQLTAWDDLVGEIDQWSGSRAILSIETLSLVGPRGVEMARASLAGHRVQVVLTARDLGRVIPAQWQESVQNGKTWSYRDYLEGVTTGDESSPAFTHFWSKHDWGQILRTWSAVSDDVELTVVTVPPSGAPRDLLWRRFCEATDLDADDFDHGIRVNESLGAASAEVVRYVSMEKEGSASPLQRTKVVKDALAQDVLIPHKADEPRLVLPESLRPWALEASDALIEDLMTVQPRIVGDLDDLRPTFHALREHETDDPSALASPVLLKSAGVGLLGLLELLVESGAVPPDRDDAPGHRRAPSDHS